MREELPMSRFLDLCRSIFVGSPGDAVNAEIFLNCIVGKGKKYDHEKQEVVKYFKQFWGIDPRPYLGVLKINYQLSFLLLTIIKYVHS